ncbi:N-acetylglucosamine-6-phosphate deacetylase [Cetobacterium ceti]|uniref:N-acetylglucosamine-6-phosphate deacetylase n=1 Tax=Cetobacterium ceti TaxID=180163 RepID=A0A1T4MIZ3_9FUSO|nr:N-acetylglucosamine-6-phosphate deacetylase [Cetobacterium ceti]SJZ66837.1 N-acetylglucosamine-6-phosphate deacetylase [Cetobacterium ceti]
MKAIINGKIFDGDKFLENKALVFENKKIINIVPMEALEERYPEAEIIDAKGGYVTPGFIDLQINGCGGVLFNDSVTRETLEIMNRTNLKYGCTSFTPTLITTGDENIINALELVGNMEDKEDIGVLGLHIEGPYISVAKKGIHNPKFIRKMDEAMLNKIVEKGTKATTIITVAPENISGEYISTLANSGIKVALGHTNATYKEVEEKKIFGISLATHLYNGMSSFAHREPGAAGAVLDMDIKAGIIVDGMHSDYAAVRIAKRIMGDRLYLVTDAVSPVGTDMEYFYFEGNKVYHKNGKCFGEDGTLGGSALTMDAGVRNLVNHVGITLEEAIRMATLYPAKAVNLDNKYGRLQPEAMADIVILNKELEVEKVFAKGNLV